VALSQAVPAAVPLPTAPSPVPPGASGVAAPPFPPMYPYGGASFAAGPASGTVARDQDRTVTGLLLLVIGIAMSWVPYVSFIGSLLALIGIILVILGRRGYGPEHRKYVVAGGVLFVLTILAAVGLAVGLALAIFSQVSVNNGNVSLASSALQSDFLWFFVGAAVVGVFGSLSRVILVYALSDGRTRLLLWLAFAVSVAVSLVVLVVIYPQITSAVSQATSGTSVNPGPLDALQTEGTLLGLVNVVPAVLFAWAYWRAREEAQRRRSSPQY